MSTPAPDSRIPEKPTIDGLEDRWAQVWERAGHLPLRPVQARASEIYSIDTPAADGERVPARRARVLATRTPTAIARYQRMRGREVFYPMGWDDNGLPTERRVQNYFGVRCDPSLPYDPTFDAAARSRDEQASRCRSRAATSSSCASG